MSRDARRGATFLPPRLIVRKFAGLTSGTLKTLAAAGKVARKPDPAHKGYHLYCIEDVARHEKEMWPHRPPDELDLDDRHWIWVPLLGKVQGYRDRPRQTGRYHERYRVAPAQLWKWEQHGCWLLRDEKPGLMRIHHRGKPGSRLYVPQDFLDRYTAARARITVTLEQARNDPQRVLLDDALSMGFSVEFLTRFSDYESPHRTTPSRKHPYLGRRIRSGVRFVVQPRGISHVRPWFWRADLRKLLNMPVPSLKTWVPQSRVFSECGIRHECLAGFERRATRRLSGEELRSKRFPSITARGIPVMMKYYWRKHLELIAAALTKPADFVYRDPAEHGTEYVLRSEGARLAGVDHREIHAYMNRPNPGRGGIIVHARNDVLVKLYRVKEKFPWLVRKRDCLDVRYYREHGTLPTPVGEAPAQKAKRGRPPLDAQPNARKARQYASILAEIQDRRASLTTREECTARDDRLGLHPGVSYKLYKAAQKARQRHDGQTHVKTHHS